MSGSLAMSSHASAAIRSASAGVLGYYRAAEEIAALLGCNT
jgi:hypothetical protein